jgi:hypothetical protein
MQGNWYERRSRSPGSSRDAPELPSGSQEEAYLDSLGAESGAGVLHSPPLLILLILLNTLEQYTPVALFATCHSPPGAWMRSLGLLAHRRGVLLSARMAAKI